MISTVRQVFRRFWWLLFLLLVVFAAWLQQVSLGELVDALTVVHGMTLAAVLAVFAAASLVQVLSRQYALHAMGIHCGLWNLVCIHFASLAAHYSTPVKIGFPLAVYLMNRLEQVAYSKGVGLLFLELTVSTWLCAFIALLGLPEMLGFRAATAGYMAVVMLIGSALVYELLMRCQTSGFARYRLVQFFQQMMRALGAISRSRLLLYVMVLGFLRFLDGLFLYVLVDAMAEGISLWQATVASSGSFFVGSISMVPMGLGTRDATLLLYLHTLGVEEGASVAVVTLQRILSTGISFGLGLIFASALGLRTISVAQSDESGVEHPVGDRDTRLHSKGKRG